MNYFKKHKLIFSTVIIQLLVLPIILIGIKQTQNTKSRAAEIEHITPISIITPTPESTPTPNTSPSNQPTPPESLGELKF